jgi:hypothetical protein
LFLSCRAYHVELPPEWNGLARQNEFFGLARQNEFFGLAVEAQTKAFRQTLDGTS